MRAPNLVTGGKWINKGVHGLGAMSDVGKQVDNVADAAKKIGKDVPPSNLLRGRFDQIHNNYDKAIVSARNKAGNLGETTKKMYDPATGTLIGEMSLDGKRGWRIDSDHVNWWDWTGGKKGTGGQYGHDFYPSGQTGPHSVKPNFAPWE